MSFRCAIDGCSSSYSVSSDLRRHYTLGNQVHKDYHAARYQSLNFNPTQPSVPFPAPDLPNEAEDASPSNSNSHTRRPLPCSDDDTSDSDIDSRGPLICSDEDSDADSVDIIMNTILEEHGLQRESQLQQLWTAVPELLDGAPHRPSTGVRQLDDSPDERIVDWHESAGAACGPTEPTQHARWQKIFGYERHLADESYKPFSSRLDWEIAQWAVKEKIGQGALNRLLKIPQLKDRLGLTFKDCRSMFNLVDQIPDRCGAWFTKRLSFKDRPNEHFTVRHRNAVEAIRGLWGDPTFADLLVYKPGKFFRSKSRTADDRIFHEMWSGIMWNVTQDLLPPGATLAPVIVASDKTQLTSFTGGKVAYPVYLTIGNIPKALQRKPSLRACVLIAYLSVDKMVKKGQSKRKLKLRNYELFHRSMAEVLAPLKDAGHPTTGGVEMVGGNGEVRRVWPILAAYVADYPEQCLVTCAKYGTCPKCRRKATELDIPSCGKDRTAGWTKQIIRNAQSTGKSPSAVHSLAMEQDVAGGCYTPFWTDFPLCDIHDAITPDVLHQLYQGVFKHLISWVQTVMTEDVFDSIACSLPPAFGVRHFKDGISNLTQVSGPERKSISKILLACLAGRVDKKCIIACRSILDFIHLAQYPSHDAITLGYMTTALHSWHTHRDFFITSNVREDFNIPKFHSLLHYVSSIQLRGTTDNYNTETFERLHIDFAKEGWRASNKRDHFPQMVTWLSRQEKIELFDFYLQWMLDATDMGSETEHQPQGASADKPVITTDGRDDEVTIASEDAMDVDDGPDLGIRLAKCAPEPDKSLIRISIMHRAPMFINALKLFLNNCNPQDTRRSVKNALQTHLVFDSVDVWHQVKITPSSLFDDDVVTETVKAIPRWKGSITSRFDTIIVLEDDEAESTGVIGCRVGRIRVIFRLPKEVGPRLYAQPSPKFWPKQPLAYVEWYSRFKDRPDPATMMYRVDKMIDSNGSPQQSAIIPVANIRQCCMLTPTTRNTSNENWESSSVLDQATKFFVNNFQSKYTFATVY